MLEDENKETAIFISLVHVWMCPQRYRIVHSVLACHSLWDMAMHVHIVDLGLWHSVIFYVAADVSGQHAASIITGEAIATLKIQAKSGHKMLVLKLENNTWKT
jgi:hypothetical protein